MKNKRLVHWKIKGYKLMKIMIQIGAVLFLLALSVATNAATRVYDVTADFYAVQNPNCVWSYGWTQSRGSTFNLFTEGSRCHRGGIIQSLGSPYRGFTRGWLCGD